MKNTQNVIFFVWLIIMGAFWIASYFTGLPFFNWLLDDPKRWCLIVFLNWALLEGDREGSAIDAMVKAGIYVNHAIFTLQRGCVLLLFGFIIKWDALLFILMFPFIHDGMYYTRRNIMNVAIYPKKWFDQSNTSTALLTKFFTPWVRTGLFVIALILYIL